MELDGEYLDTLRADPNFRRIEHVTVSKLRNRAKELISRLPCDESATFTDAGYELMTKPCSDMSWAIGRYSLYRRAHGTVGPRHCHVTLSTYYDVLTGAYAKGSEPTPMSLAGAIDSAMGRLLHDGKEWCGTGHCTGQTCQPRFSNVTARAGETREEVGENQIIRRYARIEVHATISCACGGPLDIHFPHPG